MFEILFLAMAISAVATMARRRGTDVVLWGGLALCGWIILAIGVGEVAYRRLPHTYILFTDILGWAWVGAIFLFVRFGIGLTKEKPWGMWSCPECHFLNHESAIVCEACGVAYIPRARRNTFT